jgi:hypothetical protein
MNDNSLIPPSFYQNTNYSSDRTTRKTIIIDILIGTDTTFNEELHEPLIIDKHCEVYLEAMTTWRAIDSYSNDNMGFVLKVDEFAMRSVSNKSTSNAGLIIPNELGQMGSWSMVEGTLTYAAVTTGQLSLSKSHKGKKLNYICSMNPTKLTKISGSLTDLNTTTPASAFITEGRVLLEFVFISKE